MEISAHDRYIDVRSLSRKFFLYSRSGFQLRIKDNATTYMYTIDRAKSCRKSTVDLSRKDLILRSESDGSLRALPDAVAMRLCGNSRLTIRAIESRSLRASLVQASA